MNVYRSTGFVFSIGVKTFFFFLIGYQEVIKIKFDIALKYVSKEEV